MSYCRFSSDNFGCDAYVYKNVSGGFTIHLAGLRIIGDIPKVPSFLDCTTDEFFESQNNRADFIKTAKREPINLLYSGETFNCDTAKECAEKLLYFTVLGYRIPQYAIDNLMEEYQSKDTTIEFIGGRLWEVEK